MKKGRKGQTSNWRLWTVVTLLGLGMTAVLARVLWLQLEDAEMLQQEGRARYLRTMKTEATRGRFLDRNGELLAISTPVKSICVKPAQLLQSQPATAALARWLGQEEQALRDRLAPYMNSECRMVRRRVPPPEADALMAQDLPGVFAVQEYRRYYPAGKVMAHVLGITDVDDRGREGLELAFDRNLRGKPGRKQVIRDLKGHIIKEVESLQEAEPGEDITLSLDLRIQYLAYEALADAVSRHQAESGSVVVLSARNGEVLAMVNVPSYNPNARFKPVDGSMRNRAVTDPYEPGSILKPVVVAAALESGQYTPTSRIRTLGGKYRIAGHVIRDVSDHGTLTLTGVLKHSSNVAMSRIALSLDSRHLWTVLQHFGFGSETWSHFPGEVQGVLPHYDSWHELEKATLGYGYRLSATTLQIANAYAILANGGMRRPPVFIKGAGERGEAVIDPAITRQVLSMMETVVQPGGTGTAAAIPFYRVAGKTGTAHISGKGGYRDRYIASFAGIAPASDPELVVVVTIHDPQGEQYYGGQVAAPVFREVMAGALRLLDIPPDDLNWRRGMVRKVP